MKRHDSDRITVYEQLEEVSPYTFSVSLIDLHLWVQEQIKLHGPEAYLDWDRDHYYAYDSSPSPMFFLKRRRPENDKEYQERLIRETTQALERAQKEREQYHVLKKKFEGVDK